MQSIEHLANKSHLEVSYLVLPRLARDTNHHLRMADWLSGISPNIPVHLLYCFPVHKMENEHYDRDWLLPIFDLFSERMDHVYISNVYGSVARRSTKCLECGRVLIERSPKSVIHSNFCCGRKLQGVWGSSGV